MQNLNYLFNKAYYQNLGTPAFEVDVKKANQTIEQLQFTIDNYKESPFEKNPCFRKIIMQIRYPGLIVGMGNPHGVGTKDFDWKKDISSGRNGNIEIGSTLRTFLSNNKFDIALKYAINDVLKLGFKKSEGIEQISDEKITSIKDYLLNGTTSGLKFVNYTKKEVWFNKSEQLKELAEKIADMCISGNEEIKVGFSFDYTTGQPYIPASSVKGVLRSYFNEPKPKNSKQDEILKDYFRERKQAVSDIIKEKTKIEFSSEEIELLGNDIFDNNDVFLDAVVYWGDTYGHILSTDYITPHESPVKNPVPIKILKINPGVQLEFRFLLNEHTVNRNTVSKEMLKTIFTELLSLFGVGAKTNVGYGILIESDGERPAYKTVQADTQQNSNVSEKIICPHCKKETYKYQQDNKTLNTECKICRKPLNLGG